MVLVRSQRKRMEKAPIVYSTMCNIEVMAEGYVPSTQNYDAVDNVFFPDYADSPLNLFPRCTLINPDSPDAAQTCNAKLLSFEWFVVSKSGQTAIYSNGVTTPEGYDVVTSGEYTGQLVVKTNGKVGVPRAMRFVGIYTEDGYTYKFERSIPLATNDVSLASIELMIDADKATVYNPLRMPEQQTINVSVRKGTTDMTNDERCKLLWYRRDSKGTETPLTDIDSYENIDIVSTAKSTNGSITSLTINREMIGDIQTYVVYALFRNDKVFSAAPGDADPRAYTTIKRQFPVLTCEVRGDGLHDTVGKVCLKAIVSDNQGVIENWNKYLYASWKISDGKTETEKARGPEVMFPMVYGKEFFCDIEDRGTNKVLTSDTGEWLIDSDGSLIVARDYEGD